METQMNKNTFRSFRLLNQFKLGLGTFLIASLASASLASADEIEVCKARWDSRVSYVQGGRWELLCLTAIPVPFDSSKLDRGHDLIIIQKMTAQGFEFKGASEMGGWHIFHFVREPQPKQKTDSHHYALE